VKPKAVSKNKMDKKQTKAMKSKNKSASKKYGNKANAAKAYKQDMAKKSSSYKSATPPAVRPAYVPRTVIVGGSSLGVSYYPLGGGFYGYGYMDPVTRAYIAVNSSQMIANDMALRDAGYGDYNSNGTVVVYRNNGLVALWSFLSFCFIVCVIIVIIKKVNSNNG